MTPSAEEPVDGCVVDVDGLVGELASAIVKTEQALISGCASELTLPRRSIMRASVGSRPVIVGALAKVW
jgi:hypothetical protein